MCKSVGKQHKEEGGEEEENERRERERERERERMCEQDFDPTLQLMAKCKPSCFPLNFVLSTTYFNFLFCHLFVVISASRFLSPHLFHRDFFLFMFSITYFLFSLFSLFHVHIFFPFFPSSPAFYLFIFLPVFFLS